MVGEKVQSILTRGVRRDAPRRDTTMTQNSELRRREIGDAGPTTDKEMMPPQGKNRLNQNVVALGNKCRETFG
jgi:hypothetical protein